MPDKPRLFGADYSVYVRIARLALIEKDVDHELVPVDVFAKSGAPGWYRDYHPFGKIPAFEHGDFRLFETAAITRYIDEAFPGPALQSDNAHARARMSQIVGILDSYAYRALVWDVYVEGVSKPKNGETTDKDRVRAGLVQARRCLETLSEIKAGARWLGGEAMSLADLHAAPIFAYFLKSDQGRTAVKQHPDLAAWWNGISARPSFTATEPGS